MPKYKYLHHGNRPSDITSAKGKALRLVLGAWFAKNRRDLPWRRTNDPYRIWISEVMLQQTQVKTAEPYFRRFARRFPDVFQLAEADLQSVLKYWEGLGYYSRARNLHKAAGIIVADMDGQFPDHWQAVRQLPGIGDYIAAAVLSIAFGQAHAVVDGNVKRVLARMFLVDLPVNQAAAHRFFQHLATQLLDRRHPGDHNQALMELGALVCLPRRPECGTCPLNKYCRAFKVNDVQSYPRRVKRAPLPERHITVGMVQKKGRILIVQRAEQGLLGGLWDLPGGPVGAGDDPADACKDHIKALVNLDVDVAAHLATVRHAYTHFKLRMDVYLGRWRAGRIYLRGPAAFEWIDPVKIDERPFHGALHKAFVTPEVLFHLHPEPQGKGGI